MLSNSNKEGLEGTALLEPPFSQNNNNNYNIKEGENISQKTKKAELKRAQRARMSSEKKEQIREKDRQRKKASYDKEKQAQRKQRAAAHDDDEKLKAEAHDDDELKAAAALDVTSEAFKMEEHEKKEIGTLLGKRSFITGT